MCIKTLSFGYTMSSLRDINRYLVDMTHYGETASTMSVALEASGAFFLDIIRLKPTNLTAMRHEPGIRFFPLGGHYSRCLKAFGRCQVLSRLTSEAI